jgi:hypothetical protein
LNNRAKRLAGLLKLSIRTHAFVAGAQRAPAASVPRSPRSCRGPSPLVRGAALRSHAPTRFAHERFGVIHGQIELPSYDPSTGAHARGSRFQGEDLRILDALMARYAALSARLIDGLFSHYRPALQQARTSFRPARVEGRVTSPRKDDTRLHADAFPSSPTQGRRILRVFSNVNPDGRARRWHVGEPFEDYARRFLPKVHRLWPGSAWLLERLGVTKGRRA